MNNCITCELACFSRERAAYFFLWTDERFGKHISPLQGWGLGFGFCHRAAPCALVLRTFSARDSVRFSFIQALKGRDTSAMGVAHRHGNPRLL